LIRVPLVLTNEVFCELIARPVCHSCQKIVEN
jgi:hypothetical protein